MFNLLSLARKIVGIQLSRKLPRLFVTTHQEFQERIKLRERNPPHRPYTHRNPPKDIFRSSPRSVVPNRVE